MTQVARRTVPPTTAEEIRSKSMMHPPAGGGGNKDTGSSTDAPGATIEDTGAHPTEDTGTVTTDPDSGNWINMTGNPTGCDNHPGTACGYNATNNNTGYACLCYNGTLADGWGCEPVGSCITSGPTCSPAAGALICVDAGPHDAGPIPDAGQTGTDAGGWIDMSASATACDNHAGTPCGWNPTNNGAGYSCLCYEGSQADGWGCEPPGTVVTHGPSCP